MKKLKVLNNIIDCGVVAVVRADSREKAIKISDACIAGGIKSIEITFTIENAETVITKLHNKYKGDDSVVIGAGSVLDATTARIAILAGAKFIVGPCFDKDTAKLCNMYQIPYMPGCMTVTEMKCALEEGVDIVKLFPGNNFGPNFIKSVKAPLPQVNIMPTGGVNLENVKEWIKSGSIAVGVGGNLVTPADTENYDLIIEYAEQYVEKVREARNELDK
ncbi:MULTISPECIES: bifunctional 4-hydroxy-2-oxoglutarate aldolase/2-dehydro-3-deoxy-phosphogluconate aldolase [unclassified Exiguobacterium]|uniref:bifunctional 4-hydroxy-2-oxoglutarate aldolase/2-dehydro-3-deoxy-phosphogluconate aldolase n=1 Tax=unclassified Exiguobacterium TaxID=2644629 RepID=UPI001BE93F7D|nr:MULTISPECIES: bifunctional 4-hydroxy-2-oxoglutarate aldolase/2-dehydro-3-deoxy-phosphogluconate aldolase [unclassified Exiguobacterium]